MKKLLVLILSSWLCANVFVQSNAFAQSNAAAPSNAATPSTAAAQPNAAPAQNPPAPGAQTPTAEQSAQVSGSVGNRNSLYTDRIPPEQMLTLDANDDKFQARHIADLSGLPRGAVIILHDSGQHPNWPFTASALIDDLPLHGWDTLNIELPAPSIEAAQPETSTPATPTTPANANTPPPAPAAPASNAAPTAPTTSASPSTIAIEPQAQARISAAIKYYADQNQRNIVLIGFGSGAIRAAENLRSIIAATPNSTAPLSALVMIAPLQQLNGIEMNLPKLLPLTGIAALDMVLDNDVQARAEAEARRRAVLHQRTRIYTRLELPLLNNTSDPQHSLMVKRVRTWLQKNAVASQNTAKENSQNPPVQ